MQRFILALSLLLAFSISATHLQAQDKQAQGPAGQGQAAQGRQAQSQESQDRFEIFGGYSYVQATLGTTGTIRCGGIPVGPVPPVGPLCPVYLLATSAGMNGFEASAAYRLTPRFALVVDGSANFGSGTALSYFYGNDTAKGHLLNFLIGPQYSLPGRRFTPFAHILVGAAHESLAWTSTNPSAVIHPTLDTALATAIGGGVDVRLTPHLSLRALQADYLLNMLDESVENQPRISAGVVFRF